MKRILILIVICLGFVATSKAQTPPVCTFAQVAFNSVNNTFEYHCPNTNVWSPATVQGTGGGGGTTGGLGDPGANGIVLRVALDTTTTAAASDVVALFGGGCSISSFLRGDGTCATVASFTFPAAGVAVSAGTSGPWNASLSFGTGPNALLQLDSSGRLPAVSAALLTNFPTFNQNTTGNAATANALAATPSLCTTGQAPTGILTNGNATGCAAIGGGGSGLSGMVAGQIPVAATNSTVTSSVATTGSGNVVLATSPTLVTPNLGTPSAINLANAVAPTWNQNTTGSAAKWTNPRLLAGNSVDGSAAVPFANSFIVQGTTDAGLTGAQFLGALSTGILKNTTTTGVLSTAIAADFPTLNQNTSGTAANLSGTPALPNGTTATTQSAADNTTKIATDAFVLANATGVIAGTPVTTAGVFTNTQQDPFLFSTTGGSSCSPSNIITSGAVNTTNKVYNGFTGCVNGPTSGTANAFSVGVAGLYQGNDTGTGGVNGWDGGVGVMGSGYAAVNNQHVWGANFSAASLSGKTGNSLIGNEIDIFSTNTADVGYGVLMAMQGGGQPTGDNMPGFYVNAPSSTAKVTSGFECANGSTYISSSMFGSCFVLGRQVASGTTNSQLLLFNSFDGSSLVQSGYGLSAGHVLTATAATPIAAGGYSTYLTATATLSANQLVKIDTAHDDAVVVCTTTDTTCDGFVAESVVYNCNTGNTPTLCPIITVPGSKVKGILGTGTCSRGDYVIVDTTTNGRVQCQAGLPTLSKVIGKALTAQSSVGATLDILTKFE